MIAENEINKYWNLSWWYIFDFLDKIAHNIAVNTIWECATVNWNITYFQEWKEDIQLKTNVVSKIEMDNKCYIEIELYYWNFDIIAIANFTFIKKK
jgi:hypothetical protein